MTTQPTQEAPSSDVVASIIQDVCELPGDDDPDGDDTLIVTVDDLRVILERNLEALASTAGDTLKAENERLREALQWYAKEYNWRSSSVYMCGHSGASAAEVDRGNKARTALGSDQ